MKKVKRSLTKIYLFFYVLSAPVCSLQRVYLQMPVIVNIPVEGYRLVAESS